MKTPSLFAILESGLIIAAIVLMVLGNVFAIGGIKEGDIVPPLLLFGGFLLSGIAFFFALLVTVTNREDTEVSDITIVNGLITPLIVGCFFTWGSFYDDNPNFQSLFLDLGLIMGLFFIFALVWNKLRNTWDFLELEQVDFMAATEKEKYPQFFLATLILGTVFAALFLIFKILYFSLSVIFDLETAYNWTCYPFIGTILILDIILVLGKEKIKKRLKIVGDLGSKIKKKAPVKKTEAKPEAKPEVKNE